MATLEQQPIEREERKGEGGTFLRAQREKKKQADPNRVLLLHVEQERAERENEGEDLAAAHDRVHGFGLKRVERENEPRGQSDEAARAERTRG